MCPPRVQARASSAAAAASAARPFFLQRCHQPLRWATRARCPNMSSPGRSSAASPPAPARGAASG
eukprot:2958541-Alexandrium_andersonii.AAC.1